MLLFFFFFNDTATTEIYTLSLHDALPIFLVRVHADRQHPRPPRSVSRAARSTRLSRAASATRSYQVRPTAHTGRSEEHTSELQSRQYLVCRLLLEKKTKNPTRLTPNSLLS